MLLSIDVGIRNLAMCLIDTKTIRRWEVAGVPPDSDIGLYPQMCSHLDDRPWVLEADTVLIEKQPDRNKRIKSVENFLHAYFVIHKKPVVLWDAKHKIPDVVGPGRARYLQRKAASVERCRKFLQDTGQTEWLKVFEDSKKKDDLADTVMQALSYQPKAPVKKTVKPRKPTPNQMETKYSKANLAWVYKNGKQDKRFFKDVARYYGSVNDLIEEFGLA